MNNLQICTSSAYAGRPSLVVGYYGLIPIRYYPDLDRYVFEQPYSPHTTTVTPIEVRLQVERLIRQWKSIHPLRDHWDDVWELLHSATDGYIAPTRWKAGES